jgi:hypothetical protein
MCEKECGSELNLHKLCADKANIGHLKVDKLKCHGFCAQLLEGVQVNADNFNANNVCAQNGNFNNLCVTNLNAPNFVPNTNYKAAVGLSFDGVYLLGSDINWDVIVNDPNGNVALAPFSYTAPATGYYSLTFDVNHHGLAGAATIAGIPIGQLTLEVNGVLLRDTYAPFLSFSPSQNSALSTLALLNAGDVVKMRYNVLVLDPALGLIPYVGTVILEGNAHFNGKSGFAIHFLSPANGAQPPVACQVCPPVVISCACVEPGSFCNSCR